jgi:hypothetical protein
VRKFEPRFANDSLLAIIHTVLFQGFSIKKLETRRSNYSKKKVPPQIKKYNFKIKRNSIIAQIQLLLIENW